MALKESVAKEKKPGSKRKLIFIVLAVLVAFIGFRVVSSRMGDSGDDSKRAVNVEVIAAERTTIQVKTPLSGKIEPKDQVSVLAVLQSEVTGVNVELGDYVKKGAVLFTQDKGQMQGSYDQAAASVNIAKEGLSSAKTNFERMALLYQEGAASQQSYEQAQTQYATAQQQLAQAQASLTTAGDVLKNATATAPISGYVTEVNVTQGAYPNQSMPAVSIANTHDLEIHTTVSEYLISKVKAGQKVDVLVKSLSDEPYSATITNVSPAPAAGTLTYPITVKIDGNPEGIMAGMFAEVQIVSDSRENVLAVPSSAVMIQSGETQAAVLDKDNKPSYVSVETGLDNGSMVEIKSGLVEGQTVVSVGQNYIVEGEAVNIQNGQSEADSDKNTGSQNSADESGKDADN